MTLAFLIPEVWLYLCRRLSAKLPNPEMTAKSVSALHMGAAFGDFLHFHLFSYPADFKLIAD